MLVTRSVFNRPIPGPLSALLQELCHLLAQCLMPPLVSCLLAEFYWWEFDGAGVRSGRRGQKPKWYPSLTTFPVCVRKIQNLSSCSNSSIHCRLPEGSSHFLLEQVSACFTNSWGFPPPLTYFLLCISHGLSAQNCFYFLF